MTASAWSARNGAGKSTLLKAIAGLVELDGGDRFLQPRTAVAYLPQDPKLKVGATALEATLEGLTADQDADTGRHLALSMLARFGIDPGLASEAVSGGEARRIALARALVGDPEILLLDEPTNHLDIQAIERLEDDPPAVFAAPSS